MKTIEEIIGWNIRQKRKALGLSQTELGSAVGLTIQSVSQIETGKRSGRTNNLEAIAKVLGCTREDLLKDPDEKPGPTVESLIQALSALEKENQWLRQKAFPSIPEEFKQMYETILMMFGNMTKRNRTLLNIVKAHLGGDVGAFKKELEESIEKKKAAILANEARGKVKKG